MPKTKLRNKCLAAIEKNADFVIDLLVKEVTPKEVCLALGFCFASDELIEVVTLPERPTPSQYTCRICEVVVQKVEQELNNKTAQDEIEKCLEHVCDYYPKKVQAPCKKFIDAYAQEIIKYIPNEPPKEVCKKACACPNKNDYFAFLQPTDEIGKIYMHFVK